MNGFARLYAAFIRPAPVPHSALTDGHTILSIDASDASAACLRSRSSGTGGGRSVASAHQETEIPMMDAIYLVLGAALFAVLAAYAYGCERL